MQYFKKIMITAMIVQMFTLSFEAAAASAGSTNEFNLQEVTLPSEVKDIAKNSGSVYYSVSVKNKALVPVHLWGEVKLSGLHFIPSDTSLIKGLSLAGGPTTYAKLDDIVLSRPTSDGKYKEVNFDLSEGGDAKAQEFKIQAGDIIFVKKSTFIENRAYYTSLVGIVLTVLSTFLIIKKIN